MRNKTLSIVAALSVLLALAFFGTVKASTLLEGKGTLSGTVTGEDGKPVVGLAIKLVQDIPLGMNPPGGRSKGKGKSTLGDSGAVDLQNKPNPRVKTVAKGTTDQNGKFSFTNIDEGAYRLEAGNKQQGWIYQDVEVKANEETKLDDLKLVKVK